MSDYGALVGKERKCTVCGKIFLIHPGWAYKQGRKDGVKLFCSWGCMRKWECPTLTKAERRERVKQMVLDGLTTAEIRNLMDVDWSTVYYWRKKLREENGNERKAEPESGDKED